MSSEASTRSTAHAKFTAVGRASRTHVLFALILCAGLPGSWLSARAYYEWRNEQRDASGQQTDRTAALRFMIWDRRTYGIGDPIIMKGYV